MTQQSFSPFKYVKNLFSLWFSSLKVRPETQTKKREYDDGELDIISNTSEFLYGTSSRCIDNITWNDLSMDKIFKHISYTNTVPGDAALYSFMKNILFSVAELEQRQEDLKRLKQNKGESDALRRIMSRTGRRKLGKIETALDAPVLGSWLWICIVLCVIFLISIVAVIIGYRNVIVFTTISFVINSIISFFLNMTFSYATESVGDLITLIRCARKICRTVNMNHRVIANLKESVNNLHELKDNGLLSVLYDTNPLTVLINYALLLSPIAYLSIANQIKKNKSEIKVMLMNLGNLDALLSIDLLRQCGADWCEPIFVTDKSLMIENVTHPLISNAIPNTVETVNNILLTGSNASGKSTFLKTVAVNVIFAQSILTCLATAYAAPPFAIQTSMALRDDLVKGESYYIVEIRALKRMYDATLYDDVPHLLIIDEVLRGTNTIERIAASSEILCMFLKLNCLCFAATHDIELTHDLDHLYENYHFSEILDNDGMSFDYKLKYGRSDSRNAIALLGIMGFDDETVKRATERAIKASK